MTFSTFSELSTIAKEIRGLPKVLENFAFGVLKNDPNPLAITPTLLHSNAPKLNEIWSPTMDYLLGGYRILILFLAGAFFNPVNQPKQELFFILEIDLGG